MKRPLFILILCSVILGMSLVNVAYVVFTIESKALLIPSVCMIALSLILMPSNYKELKESIISNSSPMNAVSKKEIKELKRKILKNNRIQFFFILFLMIAAFNMFDTLLTDITGIKGFWLSLLLAALCGAIFGLVYDSLVLRPKLLKLLKNEES